MEAQGIALKCPHCGAPLDASPDSVITVCRYCGNVVSMRRFSAPTTILQALDKGEVERKVFTWLREKVGQVTPLESRTVYVPVFVAPAHVEGVAVFEVRTDRGVRRTKRRVSKDLTVAVSGRFFPFFGQEYVLREIEAGRIEKREAQNIPENATVLAAQKTPEEVQKDLKARAEEIARPRTAADVLEGGLGAAVGAVMSASLGGLAFWDARVNLGQVELYFFPTFVYTWRHGGARYVTLADATDGSVITARLPVPEWMRYGGVGISTLLAVASGWLSSIHWSLPVLSAVAAFGASKLAVRGEREWRR